MLDYFTECNLEMSNFDHLGMEINNYIDEDTVEHFEEYQFFGSEGIPEGSLGNFTIFNLTQKMYYVQIKATMYLRGNSGLEPFTFIYDPLEVYLP